MRRPFLARRTQPKTPESQWFWEHYETAPGEIVDFCTAGGVELAGRDIADVGCGDGIMALGVCHKVGPRKLVGFDVVPTQVELLRERAQTQGAASSLPAVLEFKQSAEISVPADDASFDFAYSWSAFEHINAPLQVLREIHRILRPGGSFFLQLWPFYRSPRGSHLWSWFDDEFHHLLEEDRVTVERVRASGRHDESWTNYMLGEFEALNRITLDGLQRAVLAAGFDVGRLELLTQPTTLSPELRRYSWSDLAIGGVKLLASPRL